MSNKPAEYEVLLNQCLINNACFNPGHKYIDVKGKTNFLCFNPVVSYTKNLPFLCTYKVISLLNEEHFIFHRVQYDPFCHYDNNVKYTDVITS